MILDTSVLIAILKGEPDAHGLLSTLRTITPRLMSSATYVETAIVVDRLGDPVKSRRLDEILGALDVEIVDVTVSQARLAREAYRDFGKGTGHPAALNFGDVFAYALAVQTGQPLLFKGNDFSHTDIRPATQRSAVPPAADLGEDEH